MVRGRQSDELSLLRVGRGNSGDPAALVPSPAATAHAAVVVPRRRGVFPGVAEEDPKSHRRRDGADGGDHLGGIKFIYLFSEGQRFLHCTDSFYGAEDAYVRTYMEEVHDL